MKGVGPETSSGRVLRIHAVQTRPEQLRIAAEIVAIVAAGLWALYTFVYLQRIKPLSEPPSFSLPTTVEQSAPVNGVVFLTIHKRLENTGDVPIDTAAEALSVYGERILPGMRHGVRTESSTSTLVREDVARAPTKLLYSFAKLRAGAENGNKTNFFLPAHSSNEEDILIAVPAKAYPVVMIVRKDYVVKSPFTRKIPVQIVKTALGGYDLRSPVHDGEYDSVTEHPIRP